MTLIELLYQYWGLKVDLLTPMEGYDSTNYRVETAQGIYVLKVYDDEEQSLGIVKAENEVLSHLYTEDNRYPQVIKNLSGGDIVTDPQHPNRFFRVLSYLEGIFWGDTLVTDELLSSFGAFLANINQELRTLQPSAISAKRIQWDLDYFLKNEKYINDINDIKDRKIVAYFFQQYKELVLPNLYDLRKSLIHNDANDWNVLTQENRVSGLIDFGDMVYSSLINELAVGLTYVLMNRTDPLRDASIVIKAYNERWPLREQELDILYYLIAARLCTSVCNSAYTKKLKPDSDYITVSEKGAWNLLYHWITISPYRAGETFRRACGMSNPPAGDAHELLLSKRHRDFSTAMSLSYKRPFHMRSAAFQYMYDVEGHAILDAYNNIKHVGHCHPHVVGAGQRAMARLNTNTRYLYSELVAYAEHLLSYFPEQLNKVFMVNSGSAASDLAIRMALCHTKQQKIAVVAHGYHGNSRLGIDISHYKYAHKGGEGKRPEIIESVMPDTYRGAYRDADAGELYAADFIEKATGEPIAAFIAEPIVGCGGQVPLAEGFLSAVYPFIRAQGGVCISDEVQTGFGRVGTHFWGYERHGVIPDIVILGKPIGNGHPMAAVVCTQEIADSFDNGMEFFSSFGGNPVSCAIGKAVLEVIEKEGLQQNALEVGKYMMAGLEELQLKYPVIGDVRGAGLFVGIDIVSDRTTRQSDRILASHIKNELRERHILVSTDGPDDNVIKIKPPLCFDKNNVNTLLFHFEEILANHQL